MCIHKAVSGGQQALGASGRCSGRTIFLQNGIFHRTKTELLLSSLFLAAVFFYLFRENMLNLLQNPAAEAPPQAVPVRLHHGEGSRTLQQPSGGEEA
jgi:hypothetical protein